MLDSKIIALLFARSEQAIPALESKYGKLCYRTAQVILGNVQAAQECVNDTYFAVWNTVPPQEPDPLIAYVLRIVRNISLLRVKHNRAEKRRGNYQECYEELSECIADRATPETVFQAREVAGYIEEFLDSLSSTNRMLFVRRYWHMESARELSNATGISENGVRNRLSRMRQQLREHLQKRGGKHMTVEQLIEAVGEIDDSYIESYTRGYHKKTRIPWGLITATACFCLVIGSAVFLNSVGFFENLFFGNLHSAMSGFEGMLPDPEDPWAYNTHSQGALSESRYYYIDHRILHAVDLSSGSNQILCSLDDCSHTDPPCQAFILANDSNLFFDGEHLYYIDNASRLCRRDADGANEEVIGRVGRDPIFAGRRILLDAFVVSKNYLYYTAEAHVDCFFLCRIHLLTGEEEVLLNWEGLRGERELELCAARDDGVLLLQKDKLEALAFFQVQKETVEEIQSITEMLPSKAVYDWSGWKSALLYWDEDTKAATTLMEAPAQQLQEAIPTQDGRIYFWGLSAKQNGEYLVSVYDPVDGRVETAFDNAVFSHLGKGYILLRKPGKRMLVSLETGKISVCEEASYILLQETSEKGLVFCRQTKDPAGGSSRETFCYVTYEAMEDGLQAEDVLTLLTVES